MVPALHCNLGQHEATAEISGLDKFGKVSLYFFIEFLINSFLIAYVNSNVKSKLLDCYEEEAEIDTSLNGLAQNDPILVDALKNYYLSGPVNEMPYNIEKWRLNQTLLQVSNVRKLEKTLIIVSKHLH